MPQNLLITNCKLFDSSEKNKTTSILIENGVIKQIGQMDKTVCKNILDAKGLLVAPGFIDVHIQGAGGADILDGTDDALKTISKTAARFGVTCFLATTVFKPDGQNKHLAIAAQNTGRDLGGASLLGIHLEGPFISPQKKGMIQIDSICLPSPHVLDKILDIAAGQLRMMTIAPELPECLPIIRRLVNSKVIASFGHSNATYDQTITGFEAGISHVTHLFNAMPSLHHRSPGPLIAIFETPSVTAQIIPDGVHIHPAVLKFVFETLGPRRVISITDGMQSMGLPEGKYVYNGIEYESKDGAARYEDGTLIGTALGLSQLLKRLVAFTACPLETAIRTATENPAKLLGIEDKKGSIAAGKDADLVLLDSDLTIHKTIVAGKIVFEK